MIFGEETRALELSPAFGEPGAYRSVFIPTAAGPYTFHITGEIDGEPIDQNHPLEEFLFDHAPGDTVELTVQRGDDSMQVEVTLGERPG